MNKFKETKMLGFSVPFFLIMVVVFIAISMTGSMLGSFVGGAGVRADSRYADRMDRRPDSCLERLAGRGDALSQYRYKRIGNVSCNPSGERGYSE